MHSDTKESHACLCCIRWCHCSLGSEHICAVYTTLYPVALVHAVCNYSGWSWEFCVMNCHVFTVRAKYFAFEEMEWLPDRNQRLVMFSEHVSYQISISLGRIVLQNKQCISLVRKLTLVFNEWKNICISTIVLNNISLWCIISECLIYIPVFMCLCPLESHRIFLKYMGGCVSCWRRSVKNWFCRQCPARQASWSLWWKNSGDSGSHWYVLE